MKLEKIILSRNANDVLSSLPPSATWKKTLVLGGTGCWLGATDPKDLQTTEGEDRS